MKLTDNISGLLLLRRHQRPKYGKLQALIFGMIRNSKKPLTETLYVEDTSLGYINYALHM